MMTMKYWGVLALVSCVQADVYLHMPRGSNDRLDDQNRDRDNGNRLFDSQNNNRGGYNVGQVYYYTGSTMSMEWTNQHSCGSSNNNCEVILQYACDPLIRDGTVSQTIPDDPTKCIDNNCDTDVRFGRQESYASYQTCKQTTRNMGLFTSAQNLVNRPDARYTRQNPNGDRHAYECPEERDYYPYWRPSMWVDIAILTNQAQRCASYQAESQNVKGRYYCDVPVNWANMMVKAGRSGFIPIEQAKCEAIQYYDPAVNRTVFGSWLMQAPWGVAAPDCRETEWTRDNHLGNAGGQRTAASYNWTLPADFVSERCALRLRYNISTNDIPHFAANPAGYSWVAGTDASLESPRVLSVNNSLGTRNPNFDPANVNDTYLFYGLTYADNKDSFDTTKNRNQATLKASREYVLKDFPQVNIFGDLLSGVSMKLQLAIDTAQYGRTFQDRTHRFAIRPMPAGIAGTVHNVQVRGKRGNIVQVFPGVEYDFFPNNLHVQQGDYVHFQWTGSNNNPQNNDGQGNAGTDRSNIVGLRAAVYDEQQGVTSPPTLGQLARSYPVRQISAAPFLGFSQVNLQHLAILDIGGGNFGGELSELSDAGTYFDLGPVQANTQGIYTYLCTRNNNFSNRSQQGRIVVGAGSVVPAAIGWNGGTVASPDGASVVVGQAVFGSLQIVTISSTPASGLPTLSDTSNIVSNVVTVTPDSLSLLPGKAVLIQIPYTEVSRAFGKNPTLTYSADYAGSWTTVDGVTCASGVCSASISVGGNYVLRSPLNGGALAGVIIAALIIIAAIVFFAYRKSVRKVLFPYSQDPLNQAV